MRDAEWGGIHIVSHANGRKRKWKEGERMGREDGMKSRRREQERNSPDYWATGKKSALN